MSAHHIATVLLVSFGVRNKILNSFTFNRKYSKVRKWTLGLEGGKEQIAIIRASGSISRVRSPLSVSGSGIVSEQLIEKIQGARGLF